ncbi:HAD family hydrolase [Sphaerochaeta pleomorpha]|nr:HAD family hydrolase [Sphaerochaeta pleomorpha]
MKTKISICLFDMGGVVARHSDSLIEKEILSELGITGYDRLFDIDARLEAVMLKHSKGNSTEQELWKEFTDITKIEVPFYQESLWGKFFHPQLDTAMLLLIRELKEKGLRVVCATNTEPAHYAFHKNRGDYSVFNKVYSSVDLHEAKPDKEFFEKILSSEQVPASEAFFTDDCPLNCASAKALGVETFVFTGSVALRQHLNDIGIL